MEGKLKVGGSMHSKDIFSKEKWNEVGERLKNTLQGSHWELPFSKRQGEMLQEIWRNSKEKMRKNHESICLLILVFSFEIQKEFLKKGDKGSWELLAHDWWYEAGTVSVWLLFLGREGHCVIIPF